MAQYKSTDPKDQIPNEAPTVAYGGDAVASSGYKVPESETEGPKNLAGKNAALAEDDVDLEPAREKFNQTRADGDTEAKSIFKEEHKAAQQGGAADNQLQSEAAKLKEDLIGKHPELGGNRAAN